MEVELDYGKSLEENASAYFEKSKKAKKKLSGLRSAMAEMKTRFEKQAKPKAEKLSRKAKRHWFQSFHWFKTSQGFLVIAGRDAKSNETVVKKHLEKGDVFLHADIQGAASVAIKSQGKEIPKQSLLEAAEFAAARSKAWQNQLASVDVYAASREQVSKKAPSGEALGTGAFMVYGKRQWFRKTPLSFAVGLLEMEKDLLPMGGPVSAVEKNCRAFAEIGFGAEKRSDVAKALLGKFGSESISLEEVAAVLPGDRLSIKERF
jgi:predicted ribosome quality control (RQC) complex YloA/Tae2 family protein